MGSQAICCVSQQLVNLMHLETLGSKVPWLRLHNAASVSGPRWLCLRTEPSLLPNSLGYWRTQEYRLYYTVRTCM